MIDDSTQQAASEKSPGAAPRQFPMAMCPMAKICERMMAKAPSSSFLMLPGALLIALGVLIVIEPRVVVWLVAAVAILMGIMFIMMGRFVGRLHRPSF